VGILGRFLLRGQFWLRYGNTKHEFVRPWTGARNPETPDRCWYDDDSHTGAGVSTWGILFRSAGSFGHPAVA
jgi:hypothetical protein